MSDKASSCPKCGAPNPNVSQPAAQMVIPVFNPCAWHSDRPAVGSCGCCGKNMCKDCVDAALYTYENKPMCADCLLQMLSENIATNRKARVWAIVKLVFLLFFLLIGLAIYFSDPKELVNAWIYAGIGGLPSALKSSFKESAEERAASAALSKIDPEEGCFQDIVGYLVKFLFALALAPIAAVWFTIKNIITIVKCTNALKSDKASYSILAGQA